MLGLIEIDPSDLEKKSKILTVFGQTKMNQKSLLVHSVQVSYNTIKFVYVFSC